MKKLIYRLFLTLAVVCSIFFFLGNINLANADRSARAQAIMYAVEQYATIYEEGNHLVVEFHTFIHPYCPTSRHQLVTMIANADCVLTGKARTIFFYNPGRKQIAQADRMRGIRLID